MGIYIIKETVREWNQGTGKVEKSQARSKREKVYQSESRGIRRTRARFLQWKSESAIWMIWSRAYPVARTHGKSSGMTAGPANFQAVLPQALPLQHLDHGGASVCSPKALRSVEEACAFSFEWHDSGTRCLNVAPADQNIQLRFFKLRSDPEDFYRGFTGSRNFESRGSCLGVAPVDKKRLIPGNRS